MKIVITEEQKKKLFVPRNIDKRRDDLKKEFIKLTKEILSHLKISEIVNHGRIDDYDGEITRDDIQYNYEHVVMNNKNFYGFPKLNGDGLKLVSLWEETLAGYLNSLIPYSDEEFLSRGKPVFVGRMYKVKITPSDINISFEYSTIEYTPHKSKETIKL